MEHNQKPRYLICLSKILISYANIKKKKLSPDLTKLEIKKLNDTNEWAPLKVEILLAVIKVARTNLASVSIYV